jgi:hypothetical protein
MSTSRREEGYGIARARRDDTQSGPFAPDGYIGGGGGGARLNGTVARGNLAVAREPHSGLMDIGSVPLRPN